MSMNAKLTLASKICSPHPTERESRASPVPLMVTLTNAASGRTRVTHIGRPSSLLKSRVSDVADGIQPALLLVQSATAILSCGTNEVNSCAEDVPASSEPAITSTAARSAGVSSRWPNTTCSSRGGADVDAGSLTCASGCAMRKMRSKTRCRAVAGADI